MYLSINEINVRRKEVNDSKEALLRSQDDLSINLSKLESELKVLDAMNELHRANNRVKINE